MFKKIAEFFTGKKPEAAPEAPYKVDVVPAGTEASIIANPPTAPAVEAVVVVPEAVVPAAVVEQAIAAVKSKAPAIKKPRAPKAK
jgi:hypothetical protein